MSLHAFLPFASIHKVPKNRGRESTVVYDNNYYLAVPKLLQRTLASLNEKPNHSSMKRGLATCYTKP